MEATLTVKSDFNGPVPSPIPNTKKLQQFECSKCKKTFNEEIWFNVHLQVHHSSLYEQRNDEQQINNVIPNDNNSFNCEFDGCTKQFKKARYLKMHWRTHTGEKPYPCWWPGCSRKFARSCGRLRHYRGVHTVDKGFPQNSKKLDQAVSTHTIQLNQLISENHASSSSMEMLAPPPPPPKQIALDKAETFEDFLNGLLN